MRYLVPILVVTAALVAIDFYVYRNWARFAKTGRLRWTCVVYRILLVVMPFSLPIYFNLYSWWEVEPRLGRALFFSLWSLYYVPKVFVAGGLLLKDAFRMGARLRTRSAGKRLAASVDSGTEDTHTAEFAGTTGIEDTPAADFAGTTGIEDTPAAEFAGTTGIGSDGDSRTDGTITRGEFLRRAGWSLAAVPFIATGYGLYRTLYDFSVYRVDVPVPSLPRALEGLTVAQLSDLHAGSFLSDRPMWDAVAITNELRPDLIVLTGDFVNHDADEMERAMPALMQLDAGLGIFGCLGNHDHYADTGRLVGRLAVTPMELLLNEHRTFEIDRTQLHVIGVDNTGFRQRFADLPRAVAGIEPNEESMQLLLAHDPTFWDAEVRRDYPDIDLMLCGHTHGGQFGIEIGPLRWSLAQVRYERWAGLYAESRADGRGDQHLYVNRGIGTVGPPLRLGIRPEITLLTLRRA